MTATSHVSLSPALYRVAAELLDDGATNVEIGKRLWLSEDTVKTHVRALMKLTDSHTRTEFVIRVMDGCVVLHSGERSSVLEVGEAA